MLIKSSKILAQSFIISGFAAIATFTPQVNASSPFKLLAQSSPAESMQSIERTKRLACRNLPSASLFARTELFFGSLKPNGSNVSEAEFQGFLSNKITPRFPDGLTLLAGLGQFRNSQGVIIKERSRLLILLYPIDQTKASSQKIEQIRKEYNTLFQQESVLRTDELSCVSF
jgi:hypothetical protein